MKKKKILMVEDNVVTRKIVPATLKKEGHTVLKSADGKSPPGIVRTTFQLLLPPSKEIRTATHEIEVENRNKGIDQKKGRILIIDDEADLAEIYGQVLSQDHEVVVMTDGRKAFELIKKDNNFDVIFSDLTMPDMNGIDIYTELTRLKNGAEEKMIFVTGGVFSQKVQEFLKGVPNKLVEKPLTTKALRLLCQEIIQKYKQDLLKRGA